MDTGRINFSDRKCRINPISGKAIIVGKPTNIRLHKAAGTYTPNMDAKKPKPVKSVKPVKPAKAKSPAKAKALKTPSPTSSPKPSLKPSPKPTSNKFAPLKRRS